MFTSSGATILGGGVFFAWGKYEIMSIPLLATSSGELAFSRNMTLFLANHRPHMWISGRAFIWVVWGDVDQYFHASSTMLPFQMSFEDVRDLECSQTYLDKS